MKLRSFIPAETILMALDNVRAHKFRSFLTTLGVVIGVWVVISVSSILTGLRTNLIRYIEDYGTNNIYAFHLSTGISGPQDKEERTRKPLTPEDSIAIREGAPAVEDVSNRGFIEWGFDQTITYNGSPTRGEICRASPPTTHRPRTWRWMRAALLARSTMSTAAT
jgi:hypothetical protein